MSAPTQCPNQERSATSRRFGSLITAARGRWPGARSLKLCNTRLRPSISMGLVDQESQFPWRRVRWCIRKLPKSPLKNCNSTTWYLLKNPRPRNINRHRLRLVRTIRSPNFMIASAGSCRISHLLQITILHAPSAALRHTLRSMLNLIGGMSCSICLKSL